jgi:hypothetical protein
MAVNAARRADGLAEILHAKHSINLSFLTPSNGFRHNQRICHRQRCGQRAEQTSALPYAESLLDAVNEKQAIDLFGFLMSTGPPQTQEVKQ